MNFLGVSLSAGAWLAPMTALAAMASAAAIILLRDHLRLERQTLTLEADVARLTAEMSLAKGHGRDGSRPTEQQAAQPQEDRSAAAARDAMTLAFRAPLGGIVGLATLLLDSNPDGVQAIHAKRIKALAEDLVAQIDPRSTTTAEAPPSAAAAATRVLLAEDDEVNGLFAVEALKMAGAVVDRVRDGAEAMAAVEASFSGRTPAYDLILMDIRMPRVDGLDATRHIRAIETKLRRQNRLRIVAVTASTMPQDRQAAIEAGVSDFLAKPYRANHLVALLTPPAETLARAS